ncbi:MAG TPA: EAL domain-containing protein [Woeseiaceae bacterium]|nr:EAL domain-containing protein [Woeseiaceae bacterium]
MHLRTSFRGKLLLLALAPLALAQAVTIYAVMRTVERDVDARARQSLAIGATVVDEYLAGRNDQLRTSVQVLAADFGLKEAVATGDADTIRSVLHNHGRRVAADIAVLLDLEGRVIAATDPALGPADRPFGAPGDLDSGSQTVEATARIGAAVYQLFAVPVRAPTPIARVVLGFRLDDATVERIVALTGLDTALIGGSSHPGLIAGSAAAVREIGAAPTLLQPETSGVFIVAGAATDYLAVTTGFADRTANGAEVEVVLLRSLTDAMAPYVRARSVLLAFGAVLLLSVAGAAVWLSGSVARPLHMLSAAARSLRDGNYAVDLEVASRDEVGELATSFRAMTAAIAEREERISHQAMHDRLTDLPNHASVVRRLDALLGGGDARVAVLSLRLARIAALASTLGHGASDEVVQRAARLLREQLPGDATLGHLGSDEFVVLLPGATNEAALDCAENLRARLAAGVPLGNADIQLQCTLGIAAAPDHGRLAEALLRNAGLARTEAEHRGEEVGLYRHGREDYHMRQLRIVNDLRGAIRAGELAVWYQPQVRLVDGAATGGEALVRWEHAEYGRLAPDEFIPAVEEAGTIGYLTRYVLASAIAQCRHWHDLGKPLSVSVNISARDLCDDYLPYYVLQLLREHGVPAARLVLEVTESSVMQQFARAAIVLECLRDIGVRLAMDDFGTGQSSLAQLRNIPLHELKIDKSFVMSLPDHEQNGAIVRTVVELARSLGLEVVAEGVESAAALHYLAGVGCTRAQGYFLSRPVPPAGFRDWLLAYRPERRTERRAESRPFRHKA